MRTLLLAPLALVLPALVPASHAACPPGGCATVVAPVFQQAAPVWEWRQTADGSRADLYHFGRYCWSHYYETEEKKPDPFAAANVVKPKTKACDCCPCCGCGDDCRCPDGKPCCDDCTCVVKKAEPFPRWMTHGTDPEKIAPREEYHVGGKLVSKEEALQALRGGQLSDDSAKPRLTVIGSPDERKKVLAALPQDVKDRCLVKEYAPDHWAVKNAGFKTDGHPTVYVQAPDGKVLHRQDDPDNVAEAVRKADPNYDPAKDPDLRKPKVPDKPNPAPGPAPGPDPNQNAAAGWVVAVLVALIAFLWKGPKTS